MIEGLYELPKELHPLEINLTKLICNRINEPNHYEVANEFMMRWENLFIEILDKTYSESNSDRINWKMTKNQLNASSTFKKIVPDKILGNEYGNEFIIDLRMSESVYLTSNKCLDEEGEVYKTIKTSEIDKKQFYIAMISKLIEIDVLNIKVFLDFQFKSNFNEEELYFIEFFNAIIFKYESKMNILESGKIRAMKYYLEKMENNINDIKDFKIADLINENSELKKQLKEISEKNTELNLKVEDSNSQNTNLTWVGHKNPARVHYLKFLIRHYFDDGFISNEKLSKVFMIILQNEIYTPKNQFNPILTTSYFKGRRNSAKENKQFILDLLNNIKITSKDKKILDKKKIEKEQLINAFEVYWNNTKQS